MIIWRSQRALSFSCLSKPSLTFPSKLNALLQICSNSKSLDQGKQVHHQIIANGSGQNPFMVTKLVQMYADCDDLATAIKLFGKMPQPNVFAWTSIFAFYSRHGMYEECLDGYCEMKVSGVLPDGYVFPKLLRATAQLPCLDAGMCLHKDVMVCGCEHNLEVCNSLIYMYSKCKDVKSARRVFDEMVKRDLLSWNLMISGHVVNGLLEFAVEFLGRMRLNSHEPDTVTLNTVMDAYFQMEKCDEAWNIFQQIKEPNIISWTTLISGYSRAGKHAKSLQIFKNMVNKSLVLPDADCLSSTLASCRHLGALRNGKEIHGYGIKLLNRHAFYSSAGAALLTMYSKCGRAQDARNVFNLMDRYDTVTWNAVILGFADLGLGHLAFECFCHMQKMGVKHDETTISTIFPVCDLKSGEQVHAYISKSNFIYVVAVLNALIHMYSKCGCIESAYSVFSNIVAKDLVSWNTMIGGYAMHGLGLAALQLLHEMCCSGFPPNSITFTSVLSACSHSGLADEGLKVFNSITCDFCLTPCMEHFACVVDMLARAGRLADALSFVYKMPLEPGKGIWGALLAACQDQQNVQVGKIAAEHLIRLEPERAGHYITLSNLYARAGKWEEAVKVRKQMEERGLEKPSGQSWI